MTDIALITPELPRTAAPQRLLSRERAIAVHLALP